MGNTFFIYEKNIFKSLFIYFFCLTLFSPENKGAVYGVFMETKFD